MTVCFLGTFDILSRSLAHISAISLSSKRVEMVKRLFWTKSINNYAPFWQNEYLFPPWQDKWLEAVCAFSSVGQEGQDKEICTWGLFYHQLSFFTFVLMISNRTSGWSHFSFDSVSPRSFAICGASLLMAPGFKMKKCNSFHCCDRGERWWRRWPCW